MPVQDFPISCVAIQTGEPESIVQAALKGGQKLYVYQMKALMGVPQPRIENLQSGDLTLVQTEWAQKGSDGLCMKQKMLHNYCK